MHFRSEAVCVLGPACAAAWAMCVLGPITRQPLRSPCAGWVFLAPSRAVCVLGPVCVLGSRPCAFWVQTCAQLGPCVFWVLTREPLRSPCASWVLSRCALGPDTAHVAVRGSWAGMPVHIVVPHALTMTMQCERRKPGPAHMRALAAVSAPCPLCRRSGTHSRSISRLSARLWCCGRCMAACGRTSVPGCGTCAGNGLICRS